MLPSSALDEQSEIPGAACTASCWRSERTCGVGGAIRLALGDPLQSSSGLKFGRQSIVSSPFVASQMRNADIGCCRRVGVTWHLAMPRIRSVPCVHSTLPTSPILYVCRDSTSCTLCATRESTCTLAQLLNPRTYLALHDSIHRRRLANTPRLPNRLSSRLQSHPSPVNICSCPLPRITRCCRLPQPVTLQFSTPVASTSAASTRQLHHPRTGTCKPLHTYHCLHGYSSCPKPSGPH